MSQLQVLFPSQGPFCHSGTIQMCMRTMSYGLVFQPEGTLVEKLPAEIFLRIVQLGSQDDDYDPGEYAILASHICSHWRNLVVGCPSLWTDVHITNIPSGRLNLECASTFLARSGQLPLDVTIEAAPGYLGGKWVNVTGAIAGLVAPHVHRVREFHLMYTELSRIEDVMGMIPRSPTPILEALSFQCTPSFPGRRGGVRSPLLLPCLQRPAREGFNSSEESVEMFPGLRDLSFASASPRWSGFSPRNLRSLELNDLGPSTPTWPELRAALQATASTLITLVVHNSCPLFSSPCLPCTLPALESLTIGDRYPFFLESFIKLVGVPSLTELSLLDTREYGMIAINGSSQIGTIASAMQHIPLHQIHTLRLSHLKFSPPQPNVSQLDREDCDAALRAFFAHLHQLRHLTLAHPDAHTVRALSHPPSAHPTTHPVPLLSHLMLECIDDRKFTSILDILNRRVTAAAVVPMARRLELVTVRFPESVWAQLGAVGFAMFMEMVADEVRFEGMDDECPTRESLDEY